jgi:class 3 adenylate cyclase/tetratricopeptide (TPR) repeat protein
MSFLETVERARVFLERNGRVSLRALQREFEIDGDALDELVEELVEVQRAAVREGEILAWVVGAVARAQAPARPERDPRAYTPKHLADKILQSKSALEGERKQLTVLFADLKGSMELAEQVDAEEWHTILDRFFEILSDGVHRFEGTVNQYLGDGIMAIFGAPIAHEDHAQRACYAALHLRDELRRYADELRLERGLNLATRIGLNSGEVVVGKIGDDLRMDYTAQGQVVNTAQRMEQLAEPGRVYLTQRTAERVSGYFRLREVGPTRLKGARDPLVVHELEGAGEFQSRFDVSLSRGLSKFVGREREMAVLEAALDRVVRSRRGRIVGIVAEAGTGKSRLAYQFGERCRNRGLRLLKATCPPHGRSIPMGLHLAASRSYMDVLELDDRETARNKVAGRMSRADPALAADIPFMLDFMGLSEPGYSSSTMDPEARQREFLRIAERLHAASADKPDVGLFEDMHWIDPASEAVMVEIDRIDLANPWLKVLTYRPEYRPPEADWPEFEEIRLKPLSADSTAELVADLLGPEASSHGLEQLIEERAAGKSLAESGHLEGARGAYRLARAIDDIQVPDSVQAVLAARIDRLDERAKQVLQSATVIGTEFPVPLLQAVSGIPFRELDAALHALASAEFVFQESAYPEVAYAFKHPLTRQVAYDTQLREQRKQVHGDVARVLEQRHRDKLDEKAALLAHHLESAGEPLQSARWHRRAAAWISTRYARETVGHWQAVRRLIGDAPEDGEALALALEARAQLLSLGVRVIDLGDEGDQLFREGHELAQRSADPRPKIELLTGHGVYQLWKHSLPAGIGALEQAASIARDLGAHELDCAARGWIVLARTFAGSVPAALALSDELVTDVDRDPARGAELIGPPRGALGCWRVYLLASAGRMKDAELEAERAIADAQASGDWLILTLSHVFSCGAALLRGAPERAVELGVRAVEHAESGAAPAPLGGAHSFLAAAYVDLGRCAAGRDAAREAIERGLPLSASFARPVLARAWLGLGELDRALEEARTAVRFTRQFGARRFEVDALVALARAQIHAGRADPNGEIAGLLDRARDLASELGARALHPQVLEARAELAATLNDTAARERHLREAHRLYTEMRATGHAERVGGELDS